MASTIRKLVNISLFLICMCTQSFILSREQDSPPHIYCIHKWMSQEIPLIEEEFGVSCFGKGGSFADNIKSVDLSFETRRRASVEEARELLIRIKEKIASDINQNAEIRSYLVEYPFTSSRVKATVSFRDYSGRSYRDGTVSFVMEARGRVFYDVEYPTRHNQNAFFEEPYEDALRIVQASSKTPQEVRTHRPQPYEEVLDHFLYSVHADIGRKWGLDTIDVGGDMREGINSFAFCFYKYKRVSVEEARYLHVQVMQALLDKINSDKRLQPYLKRYPCLSDDVQLLIEFRKSEYYPFDDGSLISVSQDSNRIQYHACHPWIKESRILSPKFIQEESYNKAVQLVDKQQIGLLKRWALRL